MKKSIFLFLVVLLALMLLLVACDEQLGILQPGESIEETTGFHPEAHIHAFDEWEVLRAPTCLNAGEKARYCSCGEKQTEVIAALGHTEIVLNAVAATCSEGGLTEGKQCSVCGEITVPQETIAQVPHVEETLLGIEATCLETGLSNGIWCSVCETVIVEQTVLPKIACNYEGEIVAPTCEEQGYTFYFCAICGNHYQDNYVSEIGHSWGEWTTNDNNTKTVRYCNNDCGKYQEISNLTAEYVGEYYYLIGEQVSSDDIVLYAHVNDDEGSVVEIENFTLENTTMTENGENEVVVKYFTLTTTATVFAIPDNLPNTTDLDEFTWSFDSKNNCYNLTGYTGSSTSIVIPAHISRVPVRVINDRVFRNNTGIISVTIPASVQSIGARAFEGCTALTTLTLNEGLKTIKNYAFSNCSIVTLTIPSTVQTVDDDAFNACTKLTTVVIGDGLQAVSSYMFRGCSALQSVTIGNAVKNINGYAFYNCVSLNEITFGEAVSSIKSHAFGNCSSLVSINIPGSVQSIESHAFYGCTALQSLTLNEGLKTIGSYAFSECPIVTLAIPNTVQSVGTYGFNGCTKLTTVVIGDGLQEISSDMFRDCSALRSVTIGNAVENIDGYAFVNCVSLTEIAFGDSVLSIETYAFGNCSSLTSINLPTSVQRIGSRAFYGCTALQSLTLNEGLKTIGIYAFSGCPIVTLTIPNTVQTVESYIFQDCKKLETVRIGAGLKAVSNSMFNGCSALRTVVIGDGVESIGEYAFEDCSALTSITFGNSLLEIDYAAFINCTALSSIIIPDSVQTIGNYSFKGCTSLSSFGVGTGIKNIGSYSLQNCTSLSSIKIPANVQDISAGAFMGCSQLNEVIIEKGALLEIGRDVFSGCSNLDRIFYGGTDSDWALISINATNSYPLTESPYYYSATQPESTGNYWYYNEDGAIRVWNIPEAAFNAENMSETFVDLYGGEDVSYTTRVFRNMNNNTSFKSGLYAWETLHIIADTSFSNGVWHVSKKDLYKLVLFDLLCGEANAQETVIDAFETSKFAYMDDLVKDIFGNDVTHDMLVSMSPDLDYDTELLEYEIIGLQFIFETSSNMYEALQSCATYLALAEMDESFQTVLLQIANDTSNPSALRTAAREYAEIYKMSAETILSEFAYEYSTASAKAAVGIFADVLWDKTLEVVFPEFIVVQSVAKGVLFLVDLGFNVDAIYMAFYEMEVDVYVEASLRKIIQDPLPDYYRVSNRAEAETYVYAVDMFKTSILLGYDYCNNFLGEVYKTLNDEEKEECTGLMNDISDMKAEKRALYEEFDSAVAQAYSEYYA